MKNIIKNPRVTEKASGIAEHNVYTFDVSDKANKTEIRKVIFELYKVKPVKVNILAVPEKNVVVRGRKGVKKGGRKVYIYLKKEDKIEFI